MWNVKSGNKLIERKLKEAAQRKHMIALNRIRGLVDHSTPKEFTFLSTRPKAKQIKMQRQIGIQTSNSILVARMVRSTCSTVPSEVYLKDSLNAPFRNRLERQIYTQNTKLVKRLQTAKSQYSKSVKYNQNYQRYRTSMAYSRMAPFYDFQPPGLRATTRPLSSKR